MDHFQGIEMMFSVIDDSLFQIFYIAQLLVCPLGGRSVGQLVCWFVMLMFDDPLGDSIGTLGLIDFFPSLLKLGFLSPSVILPCDKTLL